MLKFALPAAGLLLALAGSANAATETGVIDHYNLATNSITLKGGEQFVLAPGVSNLRLPVGKDAYIEYRMDGNKAVATSVQGVLPAVGPEKNPSDHS